MGPLNLESNIHFGKCQTCKAKFSSLLLFVCVFQWLLELALSLGYFQGHTYREGNIQYARVSIGLIMVRHKMIFLPLSLSSSPVISSPSLPSDFYPTHHLRARAVLYPESLTARLSSQRPITTSGLSSWTPWASQHGPAWDAGAEGMFWWIRGPGRVIMALGLEGTGADPRGCTCGWWHWWSTRLYSPVRWMVTGCVLQASCASTLSPTKRWFWKSFSRT